MRSGTNAEQHCHGVAVQGATVDSRQHVYCGFVKLSTLSALSACNKPGTVLCCVHHDHCRVNQFRALLATDTLAEAATAAAAAAGSSLGTPHSHHAPQLLSGWSAGWGPGGRPARHSFPGTLQTHDSNSSSSSSSEPPTVGETAGTAAVGAGAGEGSQFSADGAAGVQAATDVSAAAAQLHRLAVTHAAAEAHNSTQSSGVDGDSPSSSSSPFAGPAAAGRHSSSHGLSCLPGAIQGPLELLGELMLQAHASYSACGLGSDGTNRLVNIVRQHMMAARRTGASPALFGAKITGGGSGGTVCVLGLAGPAGQAAIDAVAAQYREETAYQPYVFAGSSMGAVAFGHLRIRLREDAVLQ